MNDSPKGSYKGQDIIINFDTKEVAGRSSGCLFFSREEWTSYPLVTVTVSTSSNEVIGNRLHYSISDLPLTPQSIASGLGIAREDFEGNEEIWEAPEAIKGDDIAINLATCEVALQRSRVLPFSGIYCVVNTNPAYILEKYPYVEGLLEDKYWKHSVVGLPIEAEELADKLGVVLLDEDNERDERWFIKHLMDAVGEANLRRILTVMANDVELRGKVNGRYFEGGGLSITLAVMAKIERMGYVVYDINRGSDGAYSITEAGRTFLSN